MLSATKAYLCSAFLTFSKLESINDTPSWAVPIMSKRSSPQMKWKLVQEHIAKFVEENVMVEFDIEKKWRQEQEHKEKDKQNRQEIQVQAGNTTFVGNVSKEINNNELIMI